MAFVGHFGQMRPGPTICNACSKTPPLTFLPEFCVVVLHTHWYHPPKFWPNPNHRDGALIFPHFVWVRRGDTALDLGIRVSKRAVQHRDHVSGHNWCPTCWRRASLAVRARARVRVTKLVEPLKGVRCTDCHPPRETHFYLGQGDLRLNPRSCPPPPRVVHCSTTPGPTQWDLCTSCLPVIAALAGLWIATVFDTQKRTEMRMSVSTSTRDGYNSGDITKVGVGGWGGWGGC